jgi:hypothetical protein
LLLGVFLELNGLAAVRHFLLVFNLFDSALSFKGRSQ